MTHYLALLTIAAHRRIRICFFKSGNDRFGHVFLFQLLVRPGDQTKTEYSEGHENEARETV